jgi:hypothetical protein
MGTFYYAVDVNNQHLFDNFPNDFKHLIHEYKNSDPFKISMNGKELTARLGKNTTNCGSIYVLTTESKYINRLKLFRELLKMSVIGIEPMVNCKQKIQEYHTSKNEEFIHNVTSLNTYSIQDLFSLIPQNVLTENINKQNEIIKNIIAEKPNITASTLQNLIKYSLATKVEFSVFERTVKSSTYVQKEKHSIRQVILSILQIFITDFEERKIDVSLDACERLLDIDYDSLFVSLYYLMDNSIKYCCPSTKYKIIFKEEDSEFSVLLIMISIKIEDYEVEKIKERRYRSERAKQLNEKGGGLGMYRIQKTLKLNDACLKITPRVNNYKRNFKGIDYEANEFRIVFKNQKKWFDYIISVTFKRTIRIVYIHPLVEHYMKKDVG